ncbi:MAG: phosphomannomutase [Gammaproteobacteria bacterium]|nr:phosphomannomutase [Gammaproteobacteria bacterium]
MLNACFKAYDIRGRVPDELDEELVCDIARAYAEHLGAKKVVVGRDARQSGESFIRAVINGLTESDVDVFDIGLCGTEEVYFATFHENMDGGIMITASHNPIDYNGLKLVREQAKPISADSGLAEIKQIVSRGNFRQNSVGGKYKELDVKSSYVQHLLSYIDVEKLKPLKIAVNAGNGMAGPVIDALEPYLPFEFIKIHHEPDGSFPNGIPNPLLSENRESTSTLVKQSCADLGIAWDGDFDRCFLFDETGAFIESYYLIGLLATEFLQSNQGKAVVHDPRLVWHTRETVSAHAGKPVQCRSGHAFMKACMRENDAIYGGEVSGHHYFKKFSYCDSGMLPWLLIAQAVSNHDVPLSVLMSGEAKRYPISGEINRRVTDADTVLAVIEAEYSESAERKDYMDGVSLEFEDWRFNLRKSNTEPVIRLNVETRGNTVLLQEKVSELLSKIETV